VNQLPGWRILSVSATLLWSDLWNWGFPGNPVSCVTGISPGCALPRKRLPRRDWSGRACSVCC
jgi:hypothetical protein